jgi:RNA polymerase sigma factor (sigma-70 family)
VRVARRLVGPGEAEDLLQSALTEAWQRRATYDSDRGSAQVWLITITVNLARREHRRRHVTVLDSGDRKLVTTAPVIDSDLRADLRSAIDRLPARQRLAVHLHYFADLKISDLAQVMGCSEGTVKSTLFDARRALQRHLGKDYQ